MRKLLDELDFHYGESALTAMASRLAAAQEHRFQAGDSRTQEVTRTTALVVLAEMDDRVAEALAAGKLSLEAFREEVALSGAIASVSATDVDLHANFGTAIRGYAARYPDKRDLTPHALALAIAEMAEADAGGLIPDRLREAGADISAIVMALRAIHVAPTTLDVPRPTVWLLHYDVTDQLVGLILGNDLETTVAWISKKIVDGIEPSDPVIYWRNTSADEKRSGGLVGTGRFVSGRHSEAEEPPDPGEGRSARKAYATEIIERFPDDVIPEDDIITETGLDMPWRLGSILEVPNDVALKIDDMLTSRGHVSLFPRLATEITFVDDSPKADEDYLQRAEHAFVLAARLNRIWEEACGIGEPPPQEPGTVASASWTGIGAEEATPAAENSFVVHIDAPWGGGKTTFANYLTRILNPFRHGTGEPSWLGRLHLDDAEAWPREFRKPWCVVEFNAWEHEHIDPPWWVFYQAVRRQCFEAVRTEHFRNTAFDWSAENGWRTAVVRHLDWLALWLRELGWRIFTPRVGLLGMTFALTVVLAIILAQHDLFDPDSVLSGEEADIVAATPAPGLETQGAGDTADAAVDGAGKPVADEAGNGQSEGTLSQIIVTSVLVLLGGATGIWSVVAAFTQSLLPGTPSSARNYSLGSGDPLDRFRIHFDRMMRQLGRPIVVIVDDIDRCNPQFVVELLRGMQIILKSPRVVYLLLGDRNWIEQSFSEVHKAMKDLSVGPEHSLGGRFVEKSIQLSLILPGISFEDKSEYVRRILNVDGNGAAAPAGTESANRLADIHEDLEAISAVKDPVRRDAGASTLRRSIESDAALDDDQRKAAQREIDVTLAMRSAVDESLQQATQHRLVPIAGVLPANPRQIKRIINAVAFLQEIARIAEGIQPGSKEWCNMALWVVVMTEWPRSWAKMSHYPRLIDRLRNPSLQDTDGLPEQKLMASWLKTIREDVGLVALLDFSSKNPQWTEARLEADDIRRFRNFMPPPPEIDETPPPEQK